jgi:hypothetical protein
MPRTSRSASKCPMHAAKKICLARHQRTYGKSIDSYPEAHLSPSLHRQVYACLLLDRYKEQLLGAAARGDLGDTSDPRKLVVRPTPPITKA